MSCDIETIEGEKIEKNTLIWRGIIKVGGYDDNGGEGEDKKSF